MSRSRVLPCVFMISCLLLCPVNLAAQTPESPQVDVQAIAAQWPSLSAADFVKEVVDSRAERGQWEPDDLANYRTAVYEEAARRLRTEGAIPDADLPLMASLADWAAEILTAEEHQQFRDRLVRQIQNDAAAGFAALQGAYLAHRVMQGPREERMTLAANWLAAREMSQLTTDQLLWCVMAIRPHRDHAKAGFSVTWSGRITPPHTGEYVFSICPLEISTEFGSSYYHQWMTVEVNGQRIVDATPEAWNWEGNPITLTAGQSVPIKVTFRYEKNATWRLAPAILFWQGPGFARSVVPPGVLKQPDRDEAGLIAEYRWSEPEGEQVRALIEPNVDNAWTEAGLASDQFDLMRSAVSELFDRITDTEYLANFGSEGVSSVDGKEHPLFRPGSSDYCRALTYSTTPQRSEWIQRLIDRPQIFIGTDTQHISRLHKCIRAGCERVAMDLVGTWMQQQPNREVRLAASISDFYDVNRAAYRDLTMGLVWEHPESIERLESDYLEDAEGNCVLPVAYTLGIAYLVQGEIDQWLDVLHERLDDPTVSGDRRVNWLLALAQAEEIRNCPPDRHFLGREDLLAGEPWLQEAMLVATAPDTQLRIAQERLVRVAALQQWDVWNEQLQSAQQRFAGNAEAQATLAAWQETVQEAQAKIAADAEQHRKTAKESQLERLKERLEQATDRGDTAGQQRLTGLINQLEASPNE